jgi:hypothetical protein
MLMSFRGISAETKQGLFDPGTRISGKIRVELRGVAMDILEGYPGLTDTSHALEQGLRREARDRPRNPPPPAARPTRMRPLGASSRISSGCPRCQIGHLDRVVEDEQPAHSERVQPSRPQVRPWPPGLQGPVRRSPAPGTDHGAAAP